MKLQPLNIFSKTSDRTSVIKKNIIGSFLIKGLGLFVSLALVPLTINLLNQEKYGVWMTIFSIVSWFNLMDIGIGSGFRNKFTEAIALDDKALAKEYVQTLYSSMFIVTSIFFLIFSAISIFLNWKVILNLPSDFDENINLVVWVVFMLFCLQLYTKNISIIFLSLQKTTFSNLLIFLGNLLAFVFILILKIANLNSLLSIALAFMLAPIVVFVIVSIYSFSGNLKIYRPKLFTVPQKKLVKNLMGLGLKFFVIQIGAIFMYGMGNIIITQLFSPSDVTPYSVAFRLFSSAQVVFSIIITPFWSAFTEANTKKDMIWIRKSIHNLIFIWFIFSLGIVLLWILSPYIFKIWTPDVVVSTSLALQFCIFIIINTGVSIFNYYLSGTGKISIIFLCTIAQCIIYIPFSIFLAKTLGLGLDGVILSTNILLFITLFFIALQTKNIISEKAYGIWNK
ncbi:MAG: hypothetical protein K0R36_2016 [Chryseobacterium sp.]|jgi:O-antigen/teichoic acid export membrane protein|nr:hypothetical protein [Chryseobacterium sp.]